MWRQPKEPGFQERLVMSQVTYSNWKLVFDPVFLTSRVTPSDERQVAPPVGECAAPGLVGQAQCLRSLFSG